MSSEATQVKALKCVVVKSQLTNNTFFAAYCHPDTGAVEYVNQIVVSNDERHPARRIPYDISCVPAWLWDKIELAKQSRLNIC